MAAKLARLTHRIAIQLHLVVESCTICNSRSKRPVRKLLDTRSYDRVQLRVLIKVLVDDQDISTSLLLLMKCLVTFHTYRCYEQCILNFV
jgi:hypothetical protein